LWYALGFKQEFTMNITLSLDINEVQGILKVLGDLPTSSGAYPLAMKIKEQAEAQIPKEEPKEE
jgi:hypothetical protein